MLDRREQYGGEEDDVKLSSFGVKMKLKLQTVFVSRTVMSCQCLSVKAGKPLTH